MGPHGLLSALRAIRPSWRNIVRLRLTVLTAIIIGTSAMPVRSASSTDVVPDTPVLPSWTSPLASQPTEADRQSHPSIRPNVGFRPSITTPRRANPTARYITQAVLLGLGATGKITGAGRDTTADIGKPPLGINNDPYEPTVHGGIR